MFYLSIFFLFLTFSLYGVDNFVVITPEKSGTHLLTRAISLLTGKDVIHKWEREEFESEILRLMKVSLDEGKYLHMHAFYNIKLSKLFSNNSHKVIYLVRDPRDTLISVYHYIMDIGWVYENLGRDYPFGKLPKEEQIHELITGARYGNSIPDDFFGKRWGWFIHPNSCTVYFENLVGPKGGGSRDKQIMELKVIAKHINLFLPEERFQEIADQLFGWPGLGTFRSGQIGSWKNTFNELHKREFKKIFGRELIEMGYEKNLNW